MAGIVGIQDDDVEVVTQMLENLSHRGDVGFKVIGEQGVTLGAVWPGSQQAPTPRSLRKNAVWDAEQPPLPDPRSLEQERSPFTLASAHIPGELFLARDILGINPLYYGYTGKNKLCFASEVKALLEVTSDVSEFPPKTWYSTRTGFKEYQSYEMNPSFGKKVDEIAKELQMRLEHAVCQHIHGVEMGSWLSGGLDSSAIVALARPHLKKLHTFAAGLAGAPDLMFAQQVADIYETIHHPIKVTIDDLLRVLPEVIYHLESFDALLVRSTVTNYLVAAEAAKYIDVSYSGEGADEIFAGYDYLHQLSSPAVKRETELLTGKLHNTALQRVDRSASAHGLVVHVPFLDPEVVAFAQSIPVELKIQRRPEAIEKYILRRALEGVLPKSVLWRKKTKFWQGTGLGDLLSEYAESKISRSELEKERTLPNGWQLNTQEELFYYRIFKSHFGDLENIDWMGRTKGAPKVEDHIAEQVV